MLNQLYSFGLQDFLFIPIIYILGFVRINYMMSAHDLAQRDRTILTNLFLFHMLMGLGYMIYVTFIGGGDSSGYWRMAMQQVRIRKLDPTWFDYYGVNTTFMVFFVYPFRKWLDLNFVFGTSMFSLFGFIGFSYIYLMMRPFAKFMNFRGIQLFPLILFLPNMHFWASGVGKDALCFMCIAILVYCSKKVSQNLILVVIAFTLLYHVRPHMALLAGASYFGATLLGGNLSFFQRFVGISVGIAGFLIILPSALEFLKLNELSVDSVQNMATKQATILSRSSVGSAVDMTEYPFPLKIFTYLFRPLFFDAHNAFALVISFENLIYLIVFLFILNPYTFKVARKSPSHIKMGFIAFIGATVVFSLSLGNLGIAMRMKNMTMIYMVMFACVILAYNNYSKAKLDGTLNE